MNQIKRVLILCLFGNLILKNSGNFKKANFYNKINELRIYNIHVKFAINDGYLKIFILFFVEI